LNKGSKRVIKNLLPLRVNRFDGDVTPLMPAQRIKDLVYRSACKHFAKKRQNFTVIRRASLPNVEVDKYAGILYVLFQLSDSLGIDNGRSEAEGIGNGPSVAEGIGNRSLIKSD
jgi:hypothetical protein